MPINKIFIAIFALLILSISSSNLYAKKLITFENFKKNKSYYNFVNNEYLFDKLCEKLIKKERTVSLNTIILKQVFGTDSEFFDLMSKEPCYRKYQGSVLKVHKDTITIQTDINNKNKIEQINLDYEKVPFQNINKINIKSKELIDLKNYICNFHVFEGRLYKIDLISKILEININNNGSQIHLTWEKQSNDMQYNLYKNGNCLKKNIKTNTFSDPYEKDMVSYYLSTTINKIEYPVSRLKVIGEDYDSYIKNGLAFFESKNYLKAVENFNAALNCKRIDEKKKNIATFYSIISQHISKNDISTYINDILEIYNKIKDIQTSPIIENNFAFKLKTILIFKLKEKTNQKDGYSSWIQAQTIFESFHHLIEKYETELFDISKDEKNVDAVKKLDGFFEYISKIEISSNNSEKRTYFEVADTLARALPDEIELIHILQNLSSRRNQPSRSKAIELFAKREYYNSWKMFKRIYSELIHLKTLNLEARKLAIQKISSFDRKILNVLSLIIVQIDPDTPHIPAERYFSEDSCMKTLKDANLYDMDSIAINHLFYLTEESSLLYNTEESSLLYNIDKHYILALSYAKQRQFLKSIEELFSTLSFIYDSLKNINTNAKKKNILIYKKKLLLCRLKNEWKELNKSQINTLSNDIIESYDMPKRKIIEDIMLVLNNNSNIDRSTYISHCSSMQAVFNGFDDFSPKLGITHEDYLLLSFEQNIFSKGEIDKNVFIYKIKTIESFYYNTIRVIGYIEDLRLKKKYKYFLYDQLGNIRTKRKEWEHMFENYCLAYANAYDENDKSRIIIKLKKICLNNNEICKSSFMIRDDHTNGCNLLKKLWDSKVIRTYQITN